MLELFYKFNGVASRPDAVCAELLLLLNFHARRLGMQPPLGSLTLPMFKPRDGPPMLKAKAAEARHIVQVLRDVLLHLPKDCQIDHVRWHVAGYARTSDSRRGARARGIDGMGLGGWARAGIGGAVAVSPAHGLWIAEDGPGAEREASGSRRAREHVGGS